ncbi:hypothetical protein G5B40_00685 [Pikeienuella piscinae]|uniref:Uncharacterized protein n=1 Tax=Pikeienuella piscinae TaxID=2748098 RepID=A0A7L5BUK9_9RHOB|nr:hypothetical protein [Pikeienuella piscinae]QIE54087.1 hypothetical protein G5B40_00685 [Pikeienuella piscinae]
MRGRFELITLCGATIGAIYLLKSHLDGIPQIRTHHATMAIAFVAIAYALAHVLEQISRRD